nr:hypothetical protein ADCFC_06580 [Adlercreutzia hattorii]
MGDGVHHEKVVGVGDAEGDGEKDKGAFHSGVLSSGTSGQGFGWPRRLSRGDEKPIARILFYDN